MAEYLIVLSVLEGKNFPKREKCKLMVEASFDGELVETDPTDHDSLPEFSTEFTWLMTKKSLHRHRLQRTPVKVQCCAILESGKKEVLGYVILDVRLARENETPPAWYTLLNSKYKKQKPEILMGLNLEPQPSNNHVQSKKIPAQKEDIEIPTNPWEPKLNEVEGWYEIGSQEGACIYDFSVTIAFVQNVNILFPNKGEPASGLFFFYSLFGNDITTEPFVNSKSPEFPAERASIQLSCRQDVFLQFVKYLPSLQIFLCCEDVMFGKADVPISDMAESNQGTHKPQTYDCLGLFELKALDGSVQDNDSTVKAYVGVSVCLSKEAVNQKPDPFSEITSKSQIKIDEPTKKSHKGEELKSKPNLKSTSDAHHRLNEKRVDLNQLSDTEDLLKMPESVQYNDNHYFCFTVDLRKLTLNLPQASRCSVSYQYDFFGNKGPISSPVFDISCKNAITIPQSYCMFSFTTSHHLLSQTFNRVPISVKVYSHSRNEAELIGTCSIPLGSILNSTSKPIKNGQGMNGLRQLYTCSNSVISSKQGIVGELFSLMALDSFGEQCPAQSSSTKPSGSGNPQVLIKGGNLAEEKVLNEVSPPTTSASKIPESINRQAAMHLATELEAWKAQQQIIFQKQLKVKEEKHLAALNMEWINRDKDREQILRKKLDEHKEMQKQLEVMMTEFEARKSKLLTSERQVSSLKVELKKQKEGIEQKLKENQERLQEEFKRTISSERQKNEDLTRKLKNMREEKDQLKGSLKSLEKEFEMYKQELHLKPEIILKSQLDILNLEKVELERKLDAATKSKIHYKQQWGRALREMSRIKEIQQDEARQKLQRQQQELDMLKMQHNAATIDKMATQKQATNVPEERRILKDIQSALIKLKDDIRPPEPRYTSNVDDNGEQDFENCDEEENTRRSLVNERDSLLKTGVYTMQDNLIIDFNKNIEQLMQGHSS